MGGRSASESIGPLGAGEDAASVSDAEVIVGCCALTVHADFKERTRPDQSDGVPRESLGVVIPDGDLCRMLFDYNAHAVGPLLNERSRDICNRISIVIDVNDGPFGRRA